MIEELLEGRVRSIVAAIFDLPVEEITMKTSEATIEQWDSIHMISLMIALESEFGITLDVDEVVELRSVELMVTILRNKGLT